MRRRILLLLLYLLLLLPPRPLPTPPHQAVRVPDGGHRHEGGRVHKPQRFALGRHLRGEAGKQAGKARQLHERSWGGD